MRLTVKSATPNDLQTQVSGGFALFLLRSSFGFGRVFVVVTTHIAAPSLYVLVI